MAKERVRFDDVDLEVEVLSDTGRLVCLLPGLGGGVRRLVELGERLVASQLRPVAINPRGTSTSTGPLDGLTFDQMVDDVVRVIEHYGGPAVLIGFSLGNRVARAAAATRPDLVDAVVLVGAGGEVPPDPDAFAEMQSIDALPTLDERLAAAQRALFAAGNRPGPDFFDDGRRPEAAAAQMRALLDSTSNDWQAGGSARMLVVQGAEDRISPPENGHRLRDRHPDRVTLVEIGQAGHAILAEQPAAVASAVLEWLASEVDSA